MRCERCGHFIYIFNRCPYHNQEAISENEIELKLTKKCKVPGCHCDTIYVMKRNGVIIASRDD